MASLGHAFIGMAGARLVRSTPPRAPGSAGALLLWASLSMLPDADVIGMAFGVPYEAPWGHRGATHSLVFAAAVAIVAGLVARAIGRAAPRTTVVAFAIVASHGLFDTLTNGGLGCALFWPFSDQRYFAPWQPIPVSPIGLAYFSAYGLFVAVFEFVVFFPFFFYALWPLDEKRVDGTPPNRPFPRD